MTFKREPRIEFESPAYLVPVGGIIMWSGTIANIPAGWLICDGNNGTPNLLARFIQGVPTAATNPGSTGGSATHTHPTHVTHATHGILQNATTTGSGVDERAGTHDAHSAHDSPNSEPPWFELAFIMKT